MNYLLLKHLCPIAVQREHDFICRLPDFNENRDGFVTIKSAYQDSILVNGKKVRVGFPLIYDNIK